MSTRPQSGGTSQTFRQNEINQDIPYSNETNYMAERSQPGLPSGNAKRLARGLGWLSVGFGLTELFAPKLVVRAFGLSEDRTGLIRLFGLREIASGIAIFSQKNPVAGVWSRVAGDALDLATLGAAAASPDADRGRLAVATTSVLALTAVDVICARQLSNGAKGIHAKASCIVNREPHEVYQFWRRFENLPRFMKHLESVEETLEGRSRWIAKGPAGTTVEWEAVIVADDPGRVITWRSLENSDVDNAGAVRFEAAPGGRGTIVKVNIQYNPPGGVIGKTVAQLFGEEPEQQLDDDMRRFKQVLEVGEVVVSDATIFGTGYMEQRPGQPPDVFELQRAEKLPSQKPADYRSLDEGRVQR
ncbi:MAG TPA: SRPBCC family protein [Pyrinomonadaceae bacterium]|nr:SRPBCC family protein [Pyrinomonadaceae bacterium]